MLKTVQQDMDVTQSYAMRRIVQLNCPLMSDVPYAKRMTAAPELTSDHDSCGPEISDRCGRPHEHSFQTDQESLFLDHIYSDSYSSIPQRHLTSFAIKRDFFHSFFGCEVDDPDRLPRLEAPRDTIAKGENEEEALSDRERITRSEGSDAGMLKSDDEDSQMAGQRLLTSRNLPTIQEEKEGKPQPSEPPLQMYIFGQQNQDTDVSLAEASRLLFKTRGGGRKRIFTVLSPIAGNRFRKRQANSLNDASMVTALELPSESRFIALDRGKCLKMTGPTTILDAARSDQLQAVLMIKQPNVQELIRRFERHDDLEEVEEEF